MSLKKYVQLKHSYTIKNNFNQGSRQNLEQRDSGALSDLDKTHSEGFIAHNNTNWPSKSSYQKPAHDFNKLLVTTTFDRSLVPSFYRQNLHTSLYFQDHFDTAVMVVGEVVSNGFSAKRQNGCRLQCNKREVNKNISSLDLSLMRLYNRVKRQFSFSLGWESMSRNHILLQCQWWWM